MQFFFFLFFLLFIQFSQNVNNLTAGVVSAIFADLMGESGLPAVTAFYKISRFESVMRPNAVTLPLAMLHSYYHTQYINFQCQTPVFDVGTELTLNPEIFFLEYL